MKIGDRIFLALDGMDIEKSRDLLTAVSIGQDLASTCKMHDLYDRHGINATRIARILGFKPWVDHKLHDVPRTVLRRASALFDNEAHIVTVMAKGGMEMMKAAVFAAKNRAPNGKIYAVTVLTSLSEKEYGQPIGPEVTRLAFMAAEAGVDGIVCSGEEVGTLSTFPDLQKIDLVVPSTRLPGGDVKDQKRVVTQREAIARGATHLVIGSEATEASDPVAVLKKIHEEIEKGLEDRKN